MWMSQQKSTIIRGFSKLFFLIPKSKIQETSSLRRLLWHSALVFDWLGTVWLPSLLPANLPGSAYLLTPVLFCSVLVLNRACFYSVFCSYVWHVLAFCPCSFPWYGRLIPIVVLCSLRLLFCILFCSYSWPVHACSLFLCQPSPCTLIPWFRAVWGELEMA